jgi:hypothetical protein
MDQQNIKIVRCIIFQLFKPFFHYENGTEAELTLSYSLAGSPARTGLIKIS